MAFYNIFTNSLEIGLIYIVLSLGVYIAFRILDIADLGTEGVFPLGGAICVMFTALGVPVELSVVLSFVFGGIMGIITGLLHTKLKIPSLLAGIITMVSCIPLTQLCNGVTSMMATGSYSSQFIGYVTWPKTGIIFNRTVYDLFQKQCGMGEWGIILTLALYVLIICLVLYWFFGTRLGVTIRATGKNKTMSKAQGINTDLNVIIGLGLANAIIAISGALFSMFMKASDSTYGVGTIVIALGSILLGEAIFGRKSFKIALVSVVTGGFIYQFALQLAIHWIDTGYTKLMQAALFIIVLCIPLLREMAADKKRRKNGESGPTLKEKVMRKAKKYVGGQE